MTTMDASTMDSSTTDAGSGRTVYGVDDASQLVKFNTSAPGTVTKVALTGLGAGTTALAIDFRPATSMLYALASDGKVYTIATATGAATAVAGDPGIPTFPVVLDVTATSFGFDFNPVGDRIRIHSNTGQNLRLHPIDGKSVNVVPPGDGTLTYMSDMTTATIVGTAYTNSVNPKPIATTLYGIDARLDQLVTFAGPPGFTAVTAVGKLGIDVEDAAGFDIYGGMGGGDGGVVVDKPLEAYAALRVAGALSLYRINLMTGAATSAGSIGHDKALRGIAIEP